MYEIPSVCRYSWWPVAGPTAFLPISDTRVKKPVQHVLSYTRFIVRFFFIIESIFAFSLIIQCTIELIIYM